jgi:hypothetical protein
VRGRAGLPAGCLAHLPRQLCGLGRSSARNIPVPSLQPGVQGRAGGRTGCAPRDCCHIGLGYSWWSARGSCGRLSLGDRGFLLHCFWAGIGHKAKIIKIIQPTSTFATLFCFLEGVGRAPLRAARGDSFQPHPLRRPLLIVLVGLCSRWKLCRLFRRNGAPFFLFFVFLLGCVFQCTRTSALRIVTPCTSMSSHPPCRLFYC